MNRAPFQVQLSILCLASTFLASGCAAPLQSQAPRPAMSLSAVHAANSATTALFLYEADVTPEALAAIGASGEQVRNICSAANLFCDGLSPTYESLLESREQYASQVQEFSERIMSGRASQEDRFGFAASSKALEQVRAQIVGVSAQFATSLSHTLGEGQTTALGHIALARDTDVPVTEKVVVRSEPQWRALRDQVSAARERADERADVESEVAASRLMYAASIESVEQVWNETLAR